MLENKEHLSRNLDQHKETMSLIRCQHCGKAIDTDYDAEHEENCEQEQEDLYENRT